MKPFRPDGDWQLLRGVLNLLYSPVDFRFQCDHEGGNVFQAEDPHFARRVKQEVGSDLMGMPVLDEKVAIIKTNGVAFWVFSVAKSEERAVRSFQGIFEKNLDVDTH